MTVHEDERPSEDIAELLQRSLSLDETPPSANRVPIHHNAESDENTLFVGSSDSSVEGYELIQPPVADLIPRPNISRGPPLTEREWQDYFDDEGRIEKSQEIRAKIFAGVNLARLFLFVYPWLVSFGIGPNRGSILPSGAKCGSFSLATFLGDPAWWSGRSCATPKWRNTTG